MADNTKCITIFAQSTQYYVHEDLNHNVSIEFDSTDLTFVELLTQFELFLKTAGYSFDGNVGIIPKVKECCGNCK